MHWIPILRLANLQISQFATFFIGFDIIPAAACCSPVFAQLLISTTLSLSMKRIFRSRVFRLVGTTFVLLFPFSNTVDFLYGNILSKLWQCKFLSPLHHCQLFSGDQKRSFKPFFLFQTPAWRVPTTLAQPDVALPAPLRLTSRSGVRLRAGLAR